ncbi:unnamed protein product [Heterobilharzia americana]|nr:unnamed protein product [Heterobilharzia americana]
MDRLGVKCSYHSQGCVWTGVLNELGNHLNQCEYKILQCPRECGVEIQRKDEMKAFISLVWVIYICQKESVFAEVIS